MSSIRALIEVVVTYLKNRSGGKESDTDYNGVFSYAGEYHAFIIGLGAGFFAIYTRQPLVAAGVIGVALGLKGAGKLAGPLKGKYVVEELRGEPWYACAGVLLAWVLGAVYTGVPLLPF